LLENEMYKVRYGARETYEIAEQFTQLAQELNLHPVSLAVAWVNAHPGITAPIIGARNTEQLAPALASMDVDMTPELYQRIASLSPTPPLATDRHEESTDFQGSYRR